MTLSEVREALSAVKFRDWKFHSGPMGMDGSYVQVRFQAPDFVAGCTEQEWSGRKWYVSRHSTTSEVVLTCLKAVLTALEHEAREEFTYHDVTLFQPHIDIHMLMKVAHHKSERSQHD